MGRFLRKWAVHKERVKQYFTPSRVSRAYAPVHVQNIFTIREMLQKAIMNPENWRSGVAAWEATKTQQAKLISEIRRETLATEKRLVNLAQTDIELRRYLKSKRYLYIDDSGMIKLTNFPSVFASSKPTVRISKV